MINQQPEVLKGLIKSFVEEKRSASPETATPAEEVRAGTGFTSVVGESIRSSGGGDRPSTGFYSGFIMVNDGW